MVEKVWRKCYSLTTVYWELAVEYPDFTVPPLVLKLSILVVCKAKADSEGTRTFSLIHG